METKFNFENQLESGMIATSNLIFNLKFMAQRGRVRAISIKGNHFEWTPNPKFFAWEDYQQIKAEIQNKYYELVKYAKATAGCSSDD